MESEQLPLNLAVFGLILNALALIINTLVTAIGGAATFLREGQGRMFTPKRASYGKLLAAWSAFSTKRMQTPEEAGAAMIAVERATRLVLMYGSPAVIDASGRLRFAILTKDSPTKVTEHLSSLYIAIRQDIGTESNVVGSSSKPKVKADSIIKHLAVPSPDGISLIEHNIELINR
jgi:hypothetical protein